MFAQKYINQVGNIIHNFSLKWKFPGSTIRKIKMVEIPIPCDARLPGLTLYMWEEREDIRFQNMVLDFNKVKHSLTFTIV